MANITLAFTKKEINLRIGFNICITHHYPYVHCQHQKGLYMLLRACRN